MWKKVQTINPARCEICAGFARDCWKFYATPTTATHCVCDACALALNDKER